MPRFLSRSLLPLLAISSLGAAEGGIGLRLGVGSTPGYRDIGLPEDATPERGIFVEPDLVLHTHTFSGFSLMAVIGLRFSTEGGKSETTESLGGTSFLKESELTTRTLGVVFSPRLTYTPEALPSLTLELGPVLGLGSTTVQEDVKANGAVVLSESLTGVTATTGAALGVQYALTPHVAVGAETSLLNTSVTVNGDTITSNGLNVGLTAGYWF